MTYVTLLLGQKLISGSPIVPLIVKELHWTHCCGDRMHGVEIIVLEVMVGVRCGCPLQGVVVFGKTQSAHTVLNLH